MKRAIACALLAGALAACSGQKAPAGGKVAAVVKAMSASQVTRVSVSISPAGVSKDLTRDQFTGNFTGVLFAPVGAQTVTASAYDASDKLVGTGSVSVVVTLGGTVNAYLKILDTTGPPPAPDHGPLVTSLVLSSATPVVNEVVTLTANAVDPDGDPIAYTWSQDCTSGGFSATTGASTTWSSPTEGSCKLTVTATSKGLADVVSANVIVFPPGGGEGAVSVTGVFVEQPVINGVSVGDASGGGMSQWVYRTGDATLRMPVAPGQRMGISIDAGMYSPNAIFGLTDDCGGVTSGGGGPGNTYFQWTAPSKTVLCMVTATKSVDGLTDSFPVAIYVSGCALDQFEHNDTMMSATYLMSNVPNGFSFSGLTANDDDWYRAYAPNPMDPTIDVTLTTSGSLGVDVVSSDGVTVLGSGVNAVTAVLTNGAYNGFYVHVKAPQLAGGTCGPAYDLSITSATVTGPVSVSISPQSAMVRTNGSLQLMATVTGAVNPSVNWSVSPPECGWVDWSSGMFYAGSDPVTGCAVTATSQYDMSKSATAAIDVVMPKIVGTVAYAGAAKGPVQLVYNYAGVTAQTVGGASAPAPGPFAIRGIQGWGTVTVLAWIDTLGIGRFNAAADPFGSVTLAMDSTTATLDVGTITLADPTVTAAPPTPSSVTVVPGDGAVVVRWVQPKNGAGFELADSYTVYWSDQIANPGPGPAPVGVIVQSQTVPAGSGRVRLTGFSPGDVRYFSVTASARGFESSPVSPPGPVTITAPTGANTITGQATPPPIAGSMIVYALDAASGVSYPSAVSDPTLLLPYTYSLSVPDGTYQIYAYTDRGDDAYTGPTDPSSFQTAFGTVTVSGGQAVTGPKVAFSSAGALAVATTRMFAPSAGATNPPSYSVAFNVKSNLKRLAAAVFSSPSPPAPMDLGILNSLGPNQNLTQFYGALPTGQGGPSVGDSGFVTVTYDDGISEDLPVSITGVFQAAPTASFPAGNAAASVFTWAPPSIPPAGSYTYTVQVNALIGGQSMWSISGIAPTQTSISYAGAALTPGQTYTWYVRAVDQFGNWGQSASVTFTAM